MAAFMTRKEADSLIERTYVEFNDLINNSGIRRMTMDNGHKTFLGYTDALFMNFDSDEYKEAVSSLDMTSYTQYFGKFAELASLLHLPTEKAFKNAELLDSAHLAEVIEKTESAGKLAETVSGFSVKELSVLPYNDKLNTVDKMLEAWTMLSDRERQFIKLTDSFTDDELPAFLAYLSEDRNSRLRRIFKKVNGKEKTQLLAFFNTVLTQKGLTDSRGKEISIPSGYTVSAQFTAGGISLAWYKTDANGTVIDQKNADVSPFSLVLYPYKKEIVEVPALTFLSDDGQEDFLFENKYGETLNFAELSQAQKDTLFWEFTRHYLPGSIWKELLGDPVQALIMALLCVLAADAAAEIAGAIALIGGGISAAQVVTGAQALKQALDARTNAKNMQELKAAAKEMAEALTKVGINIVNIILIAGKGRTKKTETPLTPQGLKNERTLEYLEKKKEFYQAFDDKDTAVRVLNTVDDPQKILDIEFQKSTLKEYNRLSKLTIGQVAKALNARTEAARTPEEMVVLLKKSSKPPKIIARITVEGPAHYQTLTNKELAWVMDPAEIMGLSNTEIMERLGFEKSYINDLLAKPVAERGYFKITLIEDPGNLKVPTWNLLQQETIRLIDNGDKNFIEQILQTMPELKTKTGGINKSKLAAIFKQLEQTPVENINKLPVNLRTFRYLLQQKFGNNELFSSRGFTITKDGNFGLREWVMSEPELGFDFGMMRSAGFKVKNFDLSWE